MHTTPPHNAETDPDAVQEDLQPDVSNEDRDAENSQGGSVLWAAGLVGKAWAVRPEVMAVIQAAVAAGEQPVSALDDQEPAAIPGVIPLHGLITPHGSLLLGMLGLGGSGLTAFRAQLAAAVDDPGVSHIVLDVDSPGGLVDLVTETAADVRAAREIKPVTAVASTQAASAAYWIAAQADELVVTPSGEVGSVGVYMMHTDASKAEEKAGFNTSLISAGKYKTERSPFEPLSSEARKAMQQDVDDLYGMFVQDVAAGRKTGEAQVRGGFGEGRTVTAHRAVQAGMADRVATLEQVVQELAAANAGGEPPPSVDAVPAEDAAAVRRDWALVHDVLLG